MFLAKSYCDIGNSQSSFSIVAPDGEISTNFFLFMICKLFFVITI